MSASSMGPRSRTPTCPVAPAPVATKTAPRSRPRSPSSVSVCLVWVMSATGDADAAKAKSKPKTAAHRPPLSCLPPMWGAWGSCVAIAASDDAASPELPRPAPTRSAMQDVAAGQRYAARQLDLHVARGEAFAGAAGIHIDERVAPACLPADRVRGQHQVADGVVMAYGRRQTAIVFQRQTKPGQIDRVGRVEVGDDIHG